MRDDRPAAAQAVCEVRPLYGRQMRLRPAALPLARTRSDAPGRAPKRIKCGRPPGGGRTGELGRRGVAPSPTRPRHGARHRSADAARRRGARLYGVAGWSPRRPGSPGAPAPPASSRRATASRLPRRPTGELAARRAEQRQAPYLPRAVSAARRRGAPTGGCGSPPHRATSEVLAGAYPFLAEEGLGVGGCLIGQDAWSGTAFCYDPWVALPAGRADQPEHLPRRPDRPRQVGPGQVAGLTLHRLRPARLRARRPKGRVDASSPVPSGAKPCSSASAARRASTRSTKGPGPPARTTRLAAEGRRLAGTACWRARRGDPRPPPRPTERSALDAALADALRRASVPCCPLVVDALLDPQRPVAGRASSSCAADGREVGHALARLVRGDLAGLFDGPSTVAFDPGLPMLSLDLSAISGSETLIGLVMTCASTWLEAALADPVAASASSSTTKPGGCSPSPPCSPGCRPSGNCPGPGASPT